MSLDYLEQGRKSCGYKLANCRGSRPASYLPLKRRRRESSLGTGSGHCSGVMGSNSCFLSSDDYDGNHSNEGQLSSSEWSRQRQGGMVGAEQGTRSEAEEG